jgi:di/tricarboxylate transporter
MFVLSAGLMRTGALEALAAWIVRVSGGHPRRMLVLVSIMVTLASGFLNNTPVVVMMIPVMLTIGRRLNTAPSKLLLPVAYMATLGGTITLLGTSTNILVDGVSRDLGGPALGFFSFTPMGLVYAAVGVAYIGLLGGRLLPERASLTGLIGNRAGAVYISELDVTAESSIAGKPLEQVFRRVARLGRTAPAASSRHRRLANPRRLTNPLEEGEGTLELLELVRDGTIYRAEETRGLTLRAGDTLMVSGAPEQIAAFVRRTRTRLATVVEDGERAPGRVIEQPVVEAVVLPTSGVNGRAVGELGLHHLYGVNVMGVQRFGRQHMRGIRALRLLPGDVLLLQGAQGGLRACCEANRLLTLEGGEIAVPAGHRRWHALAIMVAVVLLASLTEIPVVTTALGGALLMVLSGALRPREAIASLDATSLLLLVGTIPLGAALEATGLAQTIVDGLMNVAGGAPPIVFVAAFFFVAWILTELLSNNAVAVLLTPIALSLARTTGINPMALVMVVVFGASAGFILPQGYQTYAMVMGPGGYKFVDFLKVGLPLSLLCWLTATLLIPMFWPLVP